MLFIFIAWLESRIIRLWHRYKHLWRIWKITTNIICLNKIHSIHHKDQNLHDFVYFLFFPEYTSTYYWRIISFMLISQESTCPATCKWWWWWHRAHSDRPRGIIVGSVQIFCAVYVYDVKQLPVLCSGRQQHIFADSALTLLSYPAYYIDKQQHP